MDYSSAHPDRLESWELDVAAQVVYRFLASRPSFGSPAVSPEDVIQDCLLHWLRQRHRYRSNRGASLQTYMRRVLERFLLDLERKSKAQKRGSGRQPLSLDFTAPGEGKELPLADLIADPDPAVQPEERLLNRERSRHIRRALLRLSQRQQLLAAGLAEGKSMSEMSQLLGVHRDTLYADLRRIKAIFRDDGLAEFLT